MTFRKLMLSSVAATAVSVPMLASADSALSIAAPGSASADAHIDFQVVIPSFIFFQLGPAGVGNVSLVSFDVSTDPDGPGSGTAVPGSTSVGVTLRSNATNVQIAASGGNLDDGGGNTIALGDITPSAGGQVPVPDFGNSTGSFPVAALGGLLSDTWAFSYDNTAIPAPGTYGGANINGGRVTYTATDL